jgi:LysM repeat protein
MSAIADANGVSINGIIRKGQTLKIPDADQKNNPIPTPPLPPSTKPKVKDRAVSRTNCNTELMNSDRWIS